MDRSHRRRELSSGKRSVRSAGPRRWAALLPAALVVTALLVMAPGVPHPLHALSGGPFAYLANAGSDTVSVIDSSTNTIVATIPVGALPEGVAVDPAGSRVYVASNAGNSVSVIDAATNTVVAAIPVGAGPIGVAVNAAGTRVYVANEGGNSVSVIDAGTDSVLASITIGGGPIGVAVNPAGTRLYVATQFGTGLVVVDTGSNSIAGTVPIGHGSTGVVVSPSGTRVYATTQAGNTVSEIEAGSSSVVATITAGTGTAALAINASGTRLYVANLSSDSVSAIDTITNTVIGTIPAGSAPAGLALTSAGSRLYVANIGSDTVSAIDTAGRSVIATIPAGPSLGPVDSSETLTASLNPANGSLTVTLMAAVSCSAATPTGTVTFLDGIVPLAIAALDDTGVASLSTPSLGSGSRTVTALYSGDPTCPAATSSVLVASALSVTGNNVSAQAGQPFSGPVATVADPVCTPATSYTASLAWGDSAGSSIGTVSGTCGSLTVSGSHMYPQPGSYTVTVSVNSASGASGSGQATAQVTTLDVAGLAPQLLVFGLTVSVSGCGTITLGGPSGPSLIGTTPHQLGDTIPAFASPCAGYTFTGWTGGGPGCDGQTRNSCLVVMPPLSLSLIAVFAPAH